MDILFFIGRLLFGGYFLMMGLNHFMKADMLKGYAASKGVPNPGAAVFFTGLLMLLGGLGILLGIFVQWAVLLLAIFLLGTTFKMHAFWSIEDPQAKMADMTHFMKNMALLGASLMFLALPSPWFLSLLI